MSNQDAYLYAYQNVGVGSTSVPTKDGWHFVFENAGFGPVSSAPGFDYLWQGDVSTHTPIPHIWFVQPTSGSVGDGVTIYGHGMGASQGAYSGSVEISVEGVWNSLGVTSWALVSPSAHAYDAQRTLDPVSGTIDMEHVELSVVIPSDASSPGNEVRFRTDGP